MKNGRLAATSGSQVAMEDTVDFFDQPIIGLLVLVDRRTKASHALSIRKSEPHAEKMVLAEVEAVAGKDGTTVIQTVIRGIAQTYANIGLPDAAAEAYYSVMAAIYSTRVHKRFFQISWDENGSVGLPAVTHYATAEEALASIGLTKDQMPS